MSDVVPFPGALPTSEVHTQRDDNAVHAEAFRDLEGEVCDLDRMGEIAFHDLELATFAVWQLANMAKEFRTNYQKRYHGELVGVT